MSEIIILKFLNLGGNIGFKTSRISQKIIAICDPEIAKTCINPDFVKSSTVSASISVRSARIIPLVNSRVRLLKFALSILLKVESLF